MPCPAVALLAEHRDLGNACRSGTAATVGVESAEADIVEAGTVVVEIAGRWRG